MEDPKPELAATASAGGDGDVGVDDFCAYRSPKEEPDLERIDIYHHAIKEELELDVGDGDGDAVIVNIYYDHDPPEDEPELVVMSDDADAGGSRDVGYECSHCGTSLSSRKFKVEHELRCKIRMKQKELESQVAKLYHCCYCGCPFLNEELKERHQRRYCRKRPVAKRKPSNGPYFGCDKCEYISKWKMDLEAHLLTHDKNDAEWFLCTECSYKTVHKSRMTRHMNIHSNTFSCCCPVCGKGFRRKATLDDHLLMQHSDEPDEVFEMITNKVYTCNICEKFRTTRKTAVKEHLALKHLKGVGRQKYECPRCPYSAFSKGSLTAHSKTHAEQKDYQCAVCKKQFRQKAQLDSHILYIHADNVDLVKTITAKIHRCESCSFKTVRRDKLNSHMQSKHI